MLPMTEVRMHFDRQSLSAYCLLAVWNNEKRFFFLMKKEKKKMENTLTEQYGVMNEGIDMHMEHGTWINLT